MTSIKVFASKIVTLASRLAAVTALVTLIGTAVPAYAATSSYSCGAYGQGNYSTGDSTCTGTIGAPNTGFGGVVSKLTQPSSLAAIIFSLLAIVVGITIVIKMRRKRQNVSFNRADN